MSARRCSTPPGYCAATSPRVAASTISRVPSALRAIWVSTSARFQSGSRDGACVCSSVSPSTLRSNRLVAARSTSTSPAERSTRRAYARTTCVRISVMLYFKQLLAGRDFAVSDRIAQQMVNFVYLIGDSETGEAIAVDPAYAPAELVEILGADGMTLTGALVTHYHPDHVGGSMGGFTIDGAAELLALPGNQAKLHVQAEEARGTKLVTGCDDSDLVLHSSGDVIEVGAVKITLIHTPGHTPGSQCFFVDGRLVAGDTLFLEGCGRTDLPGGDPAALYESLTQKLAKIPDDATLFPGHLYSAEPSGSMGETRKYNYVFRPRSLEQWLAMFG